MLTISKHYPVEQRERVSPVGVCGVPGDRPEGRVVVTAAASPVAPPQEVVHAVRRTKLSARWDRPPLPRDSSHCRRT